MQGGSEVRDDDADAIRPGTRKPCMMHHRFTPDRGFTPQPTAQPRAGERSRVPAPPVPGPSSSSGWLTSHKLPALPNTNTMVPSIPASRPVLAGAIQRSCASLQFIPTVSGTAPETRPKHLRLQVADASETEYEAALVSIVTLDVKVPVVGALRTQCR